MGDTAYIVFIFFYIMIDALNFWNGSPFRYPGEGQLQCAMLWLYYIMYMYALLLACSIYIILSLSLSLSLSLFLSPSLFLPPNLASLLPLLYPPSLFYRNELHHSLRWSWSVWGFLSLLLGWPQRHSFIFPLLQLSRDLYVDAYSLLLVSCWLFC